MRCIIDKINVGLYGGKLLFRSGRENPLTAEEVYCDRYKECSLYNSGCCLNVGSKCKYGEAKYIQGYTSRSSRYSKFKNSYMEDDKYKNLKNESNTLIGLIGDYVYLDVSYCVVTLGEDGTYEIDDSFLGNGISWIENDKFTKELLYEICTYAPRGCSSHAYREVIVDMLSQLRKIDVEFYEDFIKAYPELNCTPNYIGKYAYIYTLKVGSELRGNGDNKFIFDGEYLICENWKSTFIPF